MPSIDSASQFTLHSNLNMEVESIPKVFIKHKSSCHFTKLIAYLFFILLFLILLLIQASPFSPTPSLSFFQQWKGKRFSNNYSTDLETLTSKPRDSVTFLPLIDLSLAKSAVIGNTWFMSSLNDTYEENEGEYLYFPSQGSKGRLLCIKGHNKEDGTKNSYALAWPGSLPDAAILMKGLTFVSDTYYDYENLWHGICAMAPFVGWSIKNQCIKPNRWVLFHCGETRARMGLWLKNLMETNFGDVEVEGFEKGDDHGSYCFEKAVVMRHNLGKMGKQKKLEVCDLLRCKGRRFCGMDPAGRGLEVDEHGVPVIRLTLLMRRGSRSFKNTTAVVDIFARECARVEGCLLKVAQSEDLSFCEQVKVMTYTDIVASPHGAQLTNMVFMDRKSSIMEFFPKGWLELAGRGQYAHHWMADLSGMKHEGAWWDEEKGEKKCPFPQHDPRCFLFYKDGKVGHNQTFFAQWARNVLNQVKIRKLHEQQASMTSSSKSNACVC